MRMIWGMALAVLLAACSSQMEIAPSQQLAGQWGNVAEQATASDSVLYITHNCWTAVIPGPVAVSEYGTFHVTAPVTMRTWFVRPGESWLVSGSITPDSMFVNVVLQTAAGATVQSWSSQLAAGQKMSGPLFLCPA